jgi:hypothetical protein
MLMPRATSVAVGANRTIQFLEAGDEVSVCAIAIGEAGS